MGSIALLVAFTVLFRSTAAAGSRPGARARRSGCARCWANATRWPTSPPAATAASSSRRAARPPCRSRWSAGSPSRAATRSATAEAWDHAITAWTAQAREFGWTPAAIGCGARGARALAGRAERCSNSATRPSSRSRSSACKGGRCAASARPPTGSNRAGYRLRVRRRRHLARGDAADAANAPTPGATPRPNAVSRWPSAAWASRSASTVCWWRALARRATRAALLSFVP